MAFKDLVSNKVLKKKMILNRHIESVDKAKFEGKFIYNMPVY